MEQPPPPFQTQTQPVTERIVHVVHAPAQQSTFFTPWNIFVLVSLVLFFGYLYYNYSATITPSVDEKESPFVTDVVSPEVASTLFQSDGTVKIVLLHATWCDHCRIMMPAYNSAAESTRHIRWLKVEQTNATPILKSRTDIRGFPTVFGIKENGDVVMYGEREPRTEEALRKWALALTTSSNTTFSSTGANSPTPLPERRSSVIAVNVPSPVQTQTQTENETVEVYIESGGESGGASV